MPSIDLPAGTIHYREQGPADASGPPVVFIHGFLVNAELWSAAASELSTRGIRSFAPDLPLGSHTEPMKPGADQTPRGVARLIIAFLEALDLRDVTLVGSDTGGALCQFVLDTDASRIGRVVLTNCDAFEQFPPSPFDKIFLPARWPLGIKALIAPMRLAFMRRSPLAFGLLTVNGIDDALTRRWVEPCLTSAPIRRDTAAFVRAVDPKELVAVSGRMGAFEGPALLVWGTDDRVFKIDLARRLATVLRDARIVEVAGSATFVSLDAPTRLAEEIAEAFYPAAAVRS